MARPPLWRPVDAAKDWMNDDAPRLAASISFYTALALAPLLLICVAVVGKFFGSAAAEKQLGDQLASLVGEHARDVLVAVTQSANKKDAGMWATIIGVVMLLVGASGVFGELKEALNRVWEVKAKPGFHVWGFVRSRLLSFAMVLVVAFLLLVSLTVSTWLSTLAGWMQSALPAPPAILRAANLLLGFVVITLLFAAFFKFLPDARIAWSEVWLGAVATSALFSVGKLLIGIYLARATVASAYGAAGSLVAVLVWVYYSSNIVLYGAELTQAHAAWREGASDGTASNRARSTAEGSKSASQPAVPPTAAASIH